MSILIDQPQWPAHGTAWAHLVSDLSLSELHRFARTMSIPSRSFDLDHYDVPAHRYSELVSAGATPVTRRELLSRLTRAGLRVPGRDRPAARRQLLAQKWDALLPGTNAIGTELLDRWHEGHRIYHSPEHLKHTLDCLTLLSGPTGSAPVEQLALWFHDAVYDDVMGAGDGQGPSDEERSAQLAVDLLGQVASTSNLLTPAAVDEVSRLVLLTASHKPAATDNTGARVCDADLAVLGSAPDRYARYTTRVRQEFSAVPDEVFFPARARVLQGLLEHGPLFHSPVGAARWETTAQANVRTEVAELAGDPK